MDDRVEASSPRSEGRARRPWARRAERSLRLLGFAAIAWVSWGWLDARLYQAQQERELAEALAMERLERLVAAREVAGAPRVPLQPGTRVEIVGDRPARILPPAESAEEPASGAADAETGQGEDGPGHVPARGASVPSAPPAVAVATARSSTAAASRADGLTRLRVPRLGISVMVAPDVDARSLRRAVGHIPGTARPGESGNVGIAGHRDTYFRPLKRIEVGDEVVLTTAEGDFRYTVEWTQVVEPSTVDVLAPTAESALTLVTCYPFYYVGHAPERFIVRARLVGRDGADAAASPGR